MHTQLSALAYESPSQLRPPARKELVLKQQEQEEKRLPTHLIPEIREVDEGAETWAAFYSTPHKQLPALGYDSPSQMRVPARKELVLKQQEQKGEKRLPTHLIPEEEEAVIPESTPSGAVLLLIMMGHSLLMSGPTQDALLQLSNLVLRKRLRPSYNTSSSQPLGYESPSQLRPSSRKVLVLKQEEQKGEKRLPTHLIPEEKEGQDERPKNVQDITMPE
ncbi:hypothetical protein HGM15179_019248 [Zosterops borbonicus]|uniref:Uncharacterized protein n=1 Tax=Zosterops borbonicus TaxID=364589 RepID=A0A8K1D8G5_9PASS|nr:hypothetical protein HGM15179_019248 [Zosterops borbonicus]